MHETYNDLRAKEALQSQARIRQMIERDPGVIVPLLLQELSKAVAGPLRAKASEEERKLRDAGRYLLARIMRYSKKWKLTWETKMVINSAVTILKDSDGGVSKLIESPGSGTGVIAVELMQRLDYYGNDD